MDHEAFARLVLFGSRADVEAALAAEPGLVHGTDPFGFTPLHVVMTEERAEIAELLLRAGAKVDAMNDEGIQPLHCAQHEELIDVLLRHGASLEARAHDGSTPLLIWAKEGPDTGSLRLMKALLLRGADVTARDHAGISALDHARRREEHGKVALLTAPPTPIPPRTSASAPIRRRALVPTEGLETLAEIVMAALPAEQGDRAFHFHVHATDDELVFTTFAGGEVLDSCRYQLRSLRAPRARMEAYATCLAAAFARATATDRISEVGPAPALLCVETLVTAADFERVMRDLDLEERAVELLREMQRATD